MTLLSRPSGASDQTLADAARVALGTALSTRVTEVAATVADRWRMSLSARSGTNLEPNYCNEQTEREILRIGSSATVALAKFLTTGEPISEEESATWEVQGSAPLHGVVPLAELTKLTLHWRTVVSGVIEEEAVSLRVDAATLSEVIDIARAGCDSSLVGMAKQYDTEKQRLQAELAAGQARLAHQQLHDALTGLANRPLLLDRLSHALKASERRETAVAVLFADIDKFKTVNEVLGHSAGDSLLVEVAKRLQRLVRPSDTAARFGDDEFVLLCEDLRSPQAESATVARRVIEALSEPFTIGGRELFTSASIGIAIGRPGDDPESLMSQGDAAMYLAKQRGRARYELYEPAVDEGRERRAEMTNALHRALERGELEVYYQPVKNLRSDELVTMEALMRWNHPGLGNVGPGEFIPIAEETGLIVDLGKWVIETACRDCRSWRDGGHEVGVSVNLSGRQLAAPNLVEEVHRVLSSTALHPSSVTFELTESILVTTDDGSRSALESLKALGARLAIDDFGTGYSSLSYLAELPVDDLKIDRSFIARLGRDDQSLSMVGAVVELAHTLGLSVVGEGVETEVELNELRRTGCDQAQGYLLGRPKPLLSVAGLDTS